jgi:competence protein ComEA
MAISRAIYGTGWDGTVVLEGDLSGAWRAVHQAPLAASVEQTRLVNINTATPEELATLPMIGATRAAAIVAHRKQSGDFQTVDDLLNVRGIGAGTMTAIHHLATVSVAR